MKKQFKFSVFLIATVLFISCSEDKSESKKQEIVPSNRAAQQVKSVQNNQVEIKTYQNADKIKGWGYDIYLNGSLYIHQPHIPAINGEKGFETEAEARRVGDFVGYKIKNNTMPPSISIMELDSLGLKF